MWICIKGILYNLDLIKHIDYENMDGNNTLYFYYQTPAPTVAISFKSSERVSDVFDQITNKLKIRRDNEKP